MIRGRLIAAALALSLAACGGSSRPPTQPPPSGNPPTNQDPPANTRPAIDSITAQGRRPNQPARFADVREMIDVSATVRDPETPVDQLTYQWTATAGTFISTGRVAIWTAPDSIASPTTVTITLKVIEAFGHPGQAKTFSHDTTSTVTVSVHDSVKEVGDMSARFLTEFSKPQINRDWRDVMKDFNRDVCPVKSEYDDERRSVEDHIANYVMNTFSVGVPNVRLGFGGTCDFGLPGDACSSARVMWDSKGPDGGVTRGTDYLTAVYSTTNDRWWLCSSRYIPDSTADRSFYTGR
jgi:hypothetical protein